jgi:hypothetical protein
MPPKKTEPDFLHEAAGHYLSDMPFWSGEKIVTYLEENPDDYSKKIDAWYPFEGFCGEELADNIRNLAGRFEYFYNLQPTTHMPKPTRKTTAADVYHWLGSDNTLEQAVEIIADVANGDYKPKLLKEEISDLAE